MTTNSTFRQQYGPWAIVTGAASGIGKEFTNQLAALNLDILAIDIQEEKLQEQVAFLKQHYGIDASSLFTSHMLPRKQAIKLFGDNMRKLYAHRA